MRSLLSDLYCMPSSCWNNRFQYDVEEENATSPNSQNDTQPEFDGDEDSNKEGRSYQRHHDFTIYSKNYRSEYESYEHSVVKKRLANDSILPLDVNNYYWNLKEYVYVSIDVIRMIFIPLSYILKKPLYDMPIIESPS